jgi:hypothetical protein
MRRRNGLWLGLLGGLASLGMTGPVLGQSQSETTTQSFSPSFVMSAHAAPPSFWQRLFSWLPSFGSSTPSTATRAAQPASGYNGLSPGEMMSTRPLQGTPVSKFRPIQ